MMHKTFLQLLCFLLAGQLCGAQNVDFLKRYGNPGNNNDGNEVVTLPDGSSLIAGTTNSAIAAGNTGILLMKVNAAGDQVWAREIGEINENEFAESMVILPNGKIVIAGNTTGADGNTNALLLCTDSSGMVYWRKTFGGNAQDGFNTLKATNNGFIAGGVTYSKGAGGGDAWLVNTDGTGNLIWEKTYGGTEYDDCWDMELTPDKGFIFTGGTYSNANGLYDDAWVTRTDANGNVLWTKNYGLADRVDWAWAITPITDANAITGYAFVGVKNTETTNPGATMGDLHFVKIDLNGNVIWDRSIDIPIGSLRKEGTDVQQAPDGSFTICGYLLTNTARQLYIVHTSGNGDIMWDTSIGFREAFIPSALAHHNNGSVTITGQWQTGPGMQYVFAAKVSNIPLGISTATTINPLVVYPNPAKDNVAIYCSNKAKMEQIQLYDATGKHISNTMPIAGEKASVSLNNCTTGYLLLKIKTDKGIFYQTLLKE